MNETQMATLLATIWIAPHVGKNYGLIAGCGFVLYASLKGLGIL